MHRRSLLLAAVSAGVGACASPRGQDAAASVRSTDDFDVALYRQIASRGGSQFISPYSVSSAFALLYPGARGATARDIASTFGFDPFPAAAAANARATAAALQSSTGGSEFTSANAAWVERTLSLDPAYARMVSEELGGVIQPVDFIAAQEAALAEINAWAAQSTRERIRELLSTVNPDRRLVLTNAVYFKGRWTDRFSPASTTDGRFHTPSGTRVPARLMRRLGRVRYFETLTFQAAEFDYDQGEFALAVFLPQRPSGLERFERGLTGPVLDAWLRRLATAETSRLDVTLPKVELRGDYELEPSLRALGLTSVFEPAADLSGIAAAPALAVSAVIHKTFLKIDEDGTEAAAATAIDVVVTSARREPEPPPIEFRADRPFFMVLLHKRTGIRLFLGRVASIEA